MSTIGAQLDLAAYAAEVAAQAQVAARGLAVATGEQKDRWLRRSAELIRGRMGELLAANEKDVAHAPAYGLSPAAVDRLRLDGKRLEAVAAALEEIALLPNPVGEVIDSSIRPNGLEVLRVRVPLGVVFFIYESRPNVTADAAAICVKSGNAVILRGGKEAIHSNQALHSLLQEALEEAGLPWAAVQLVETTDRAAVGQFLKLRDKISVTIPRGGKSLIERVAAEATMPVIKHFDGICHVYVDRAADVDMARRIIVNAKCQRPGVCNAAECLLVHQEIAEKFLRVTADDLRSRGVELRCCERSRRLIPGSRPATDDDYRTEYLDLILSVKIVDDLEQAIEHIEGYGSHHTETIVTNDLAAARRFVAAVDSAAVLVNASTRFNDGGEFGLGAEIGISTDKLHARGPCGLRELTSYKFVAWGDGQVRG
ncbi:MAG: glutamate-5-semialdehyde dehydrogenase [Planctomycetaceae bacterium]